MRLSRELSAGSANRNWRCAKVIGRASFDLQAMLDTLVKSAARLCEADLVAIHRPRDGAMHFAANFGLSHEWEEIVKRAPIVPGRGTATGRVLLTGKVVQIADVEADPEYTFTQGQKAGGFRTVLAVPLEREGETIGVIVLCRTKVRPFTDKQIELVQNFAAQAGIAIENARLLNELQQRTKDLGEALDQQTATADVLKVISRSQFDLQLVLDNLIETATSLCGAKRGVIFRADGDLYHAAAFYNATPELIEFVKSHPVAPGRGTITARVALERRVVHVADLQEDAEYTYALRDTEPIRTELGVPMFRGDDLVGVFILYKLKVEPFTDKQIELVTTFADQAVIAIENARLLNELREALERQTGTSEVLGVISSSPGELGPVFRVVIENATRLCGAHFGALVLYDGKAFRSVALYNVPAPYVESGVGDVIEPHPEAALGRIVRTREPVQIEDLRALAAYREGNRWVTSFADLAGVRTLLVVPMLRENELVGAIGIYRQEVRPFTDKQIELVKNFAAQAVIAIENARLLNELRQRTTDLTESLEQQTATSEVLQVISNSPGNVEPAFAAMLERAARICNANFGNIFRWDGDALRLVAAQNTPAGLVEQRSRSPFRPDPTGPLGRMLESRTLVHVADLAAEKSYTEQRQPGIVAAVELGGVRTNLLVPMLKEGELVGVFSLYRQEVRPFTDKQIELVENFAAQAVIAIENARLLNELRQSLEQQTATSEVLRVISSSTGDLAHVFATMLENATRICEAKFGTLYLKEGDGFRATATHNAPPAYEEARAQIVHPSPQTTLWRSANAKRAVQIADTTKEQGYLQGEPFVVSAVTKGGYRSVLSVPMLHEDQVVGVITIFRQETGSFGDEHISLLQNFAAQAVIAIENARLLNDLRDRTQQLQVQSEELAKLNEQLEQRVDDQVGEIERMSRLRRFLPPQVADLIVASGSEKQLESHRREITALFCDLRGFTGFTESADAEDVMHLLRDYHAAIGQLVIKYSGTLERYAGDGVMVIFNDPVPVENPALQAVLMALEMRDAIGALTETWRRWGHDIGFGIGIAHGFATLGTIGFEGRFDYAAIGTVSNVASRLCDEAKPGQILISPRVLTKVENAVKVEPVGEFALKGIRRPLAAYNVVAALASKI